MSFISRTFPQRRFAIPTAALLIGALTFGGHLPVSAQNSSIDTTAVQIGFMGASQGIRADQDKALYQAAVLAAEQVNVDADNKLVDPNGTRYTLDVHFYPANSSADLQSAYNDARDDGTLVLLGPDDSASLNTLLGAVTPSFAILSASSDAPTTNNKVIRLAPATTDSAAAIGDYMVNHRSFGKIAIVAADTTQAQADVRAFTAKAESTNIVLTVKQAADSLDFDATARDIRDKDADAVYFWLPDAQANALIDRLQTVGWDKVIVGQGETALPSTAAKMTGEFIGSSVWDTSGYDNLSQQFVIDYQTRWNAAPLDNAAAYYDAIKLIASAIRTSGKDRTAVANALRTQKSYRGVQGTYNKGTINALRLIDLNADNARVEAAFYNDGQCTNCSDDSRPDVTAKTVTATKTVTLALVGTLDGVAKPIGDAASHGAALAIDAINASGGIIGPNNTRYVLALNSINAAVSSDLASAFTSAKTIGASAILGPDLNGQILPQLTLASSQGIPQMVSATSAQIVGKTAQNYVFQTRPNDSTLALAAADYLVNQRSLTSFGTFAIRADYGLNTARAVKDYIATSDDAHVTLMLDHAVDATDFSSYAAQIAGSDVQALFVWTSQPAAKALLAELGKSKWQGTFVYGYLTPDFAATLTIPDGITLIAPVNWWTTAQDWSSQNFTARFTQRYGTAPLPQSAAYYDDVYLIARGIEKVGGDPKALQGWLVQQTSFRGVQGIYAPATYTNGESIRAALLITWDSKGAHELARYDNGSCWAGCNPHVVSRYHRQNPTQ